MNDNEKRLLDRILSNADIKGGEIAVFNSMAEKIFKAFFKDPEEKDPQQDDVSSIYDNEMIK